MYHWMSIYLLLDADRGKGPLYLPKVFFPLLHLPKVFFPLFSWLHKANATYFCIKGEKHEAKVMGPGLTSESEYTKVTYTVTLLLGALSTSLCLQKTTELSG